MSADHDADRDFWLDHPIDDDDESSVEEQTTRGSHTRNYSAEMRHNNPRSEPVGHFTGRCSRCGSKDLWDDNMHYGCNACGAFLG